MSGGVGTQPPSTSIRRRGPFRFTLAPTSKLVRGAVEFQLADWGNFHLVFRRVVYQNLALGLLVIRREFSEDVYLHNLMTVQPVHSLQPLPEELIFFSRSLVLIQRHEVHEDPRHGILGYSNSRYLSTMLRTWNPQGSGCSIASHMWEMDRNRTMEGPSAVRIVTCPHRADTM